MLPATMEPSASGFAVSRLVLLRHCIPHSGSRALYLRLQPPSPPSGSSCPASPWPCSPTAPEVPAVRPQPVRRSVPSGSGSLPARSPRCDPARHPRHPVSTSGLPAQAGGQRINLDVELSIPLLAAHTLRLGDSFDPLRTLCSICCSSTSLTAASRRLRGSPCR